MLGGHEDAQTRPRVRFTVTGAMLAAVGTTETLKKKVRGPVKADFWQHPPPSPHFWGERRKETQRICSEKVPRAGGAHGGAHLRLRRRRTEERLGGRLGVPASG